jgi:DNA-directed RNA polymerase specialized sigma24 family protein
VVTVSPWSRIERKQVATIESRTRPAQPQAAVDLEAAFAAARPRLVRIAVSLVGHASAEDVVHDTYLAARAHRDQLRDPAAIEAWLARICVRACFRVQRRGRQLQRIVAVLSTPRSTPAPAGVELRELIERLPPRERAVVVLQHGYGYNLAEVARLLDISHANARAIASRTRRALLRAWQEGER